MRGVIKLSLKRLECSTKESAEGFMIIFFGLCLHCSLQSCTKLQDLYEAIEPWKYQALWGQGDSNSLSLHTLSITIWNVSGRASVGFSKSWKKVDDPFSHIFMFPFASEEGVDCRVHGFHGLHQASHKWKQYEPQSINGQLYILYICVHVCFALHIPVR